MPDAKVLAIGGSIIAVAALLVLWRVRQDAIAVGGAVVDLAGTVGHAVNPLNQNNAAAGTVNAVGQALSGDAGWSLGTWIYDMTGKP